VVRATVGITLAVVGLGAWSLVLGYVAGTLAWDAGLWASVAWHPSRRPRLGRVPALFRFGGGVTVIGVIGIGMSYVDNLFVGRVLGPVALGLYSLGYRVPDVTLGSAYGMATTVLFPAYATLEREPMQAAVVTSFRYALLLGLPFTVGLIALADPMVHALFGSKWSDAAPVMQLIGLTYVGAPLRVMSSAYYALRRVDVQVKLAITQGVLLVALLAVFVDHGIVAVAGCQLGTRGLYVPIGLVVAVRVLGLRWRDLWAAAWPALAAGAGMAAVLFPLERFVESPWAALALGSLLGAATYLGLVRILAPGALPELRRLASGPVS
jgi:O-antigen/teichoic acid export membrane protein